MDPICEEKYNFLQKYVPFLANLIELLANDKEKQDKLAQMQLLYNLLNKPDNSVKIETLEKCEEVLCRVFGNNDEKLEGGEDWIMPSPLIKEELPEEPDESSEHNQEENSENINGSLEHQCDGEATTTQSTSLHTDDSIIKDATNSSTEEKINTCAPEQMVGSEDEPSKQPNFLADESQESNSQKSINPESIAVEEGHAETSPKEEESHDVGTKIKPEDEMKADAISEVERESISDSTNKGETENESTSSIEALELNGLQASNPEDSDEKEVQRDLESNTSIDVSSTNDLAKVNNLPEANDPAEGNDLAKEEDLAEENTPTETNNPPESSDPFGANDPSEVSDSCEAEVPPKSSVPSEVSDSAEANDPAYAKDAPESSDPSQASDSAEANDPAHAKDAPESSDPSKASDSAEAKDPAHAKDAPESSDLSEANVPSQASDSTEAKDPRESSDPSEANDQAEAKDLPGANNEVVKPDKEETEKTEEETSDSNKPPDKIEAVESQQLENKNELSVCKPSDTENDPKDEEKTDKKEGTLIDNLATATNVEDNSQTDKDKAQPTLEVKEKPSEVEKSDKIDEASTKNISKIDDQEESQNKSDTTEELTEGQEDVIRQSQTEMLTFKIVSAESLAPIELLSTDSKTDENLTDSSNIQSKDTAKETTTTSSETDKDQLDPLDPLNPSKKTPENLLKTTKPLENGSTPPKDTHKDEDDDDVLLVETRSSPICIDSDPEDEENMKGNRSMPVSLTKTPINKHKSLLPKPKVRKSTSAVMESIRHIINKNQNMAIKKKFPNQNRPSAFRETAFVKKDPKALMETIDLLDSDSEDERPKNNFKKAKTKANTDDDVIIVSSSQPQRPLQHRPPQRKLLAKKTAKIVPPSKQIGRLPPRLTNKSPQKPATAQSNFLNAVNLQPAPKSNSSNPASFSAQLSNKKVIIPNAFYGNPSYNRKSPSSSTSATAPSKGSSATQDEAKSNDSVPTPPPRTVGVYSGVSIRHVQDKVLKEWLEGFLTNFASPLQIASHACFVLLQRVLKYRFFQRLKETRIFLNTIAKSCPSETVDVQMLLDLRNVFLENDYLTEAGRRFCRFATNDAFGKPVALTTDAKTGRVTCRTRVATKGDLPTVIANTPNNSSIKNTKPITTAEKPAVSTVQSPAAVASNSKPILNTPKNTSSPMSNASTPSSVPKRRGKFRKLSDGLIVAEKDEDDNDYTPTTNEIEPEAEIVTERKRSLRTNRTKRKEAGFTYSEDHDDEEFEALARKIENKKREEQRLADEREEMERELLEQQRKAIKKTVAKKTTSKRQGGQIDTTKGPTRKKLRLANASIVGSEDNDLLTPTWIEADGDDAEVDSLLDFADEPQSPETTEKNPVFESDNTQTENSEIEETSQDLPEYFDEQTNKSLKNIDRKLHLHCQEHDFCVHCQRRVPRIVHHYVNEHRSSEVFPSRLRNRDVRRLLTTSNVGFVHLYKGNQIQYAAHCIFCDKEAKFLLPYWFEHFTMHTGEYSFKCSGCHILKPTRSLLTNHLQSNSGCPKKGKAAIRLVNFDTKVHQIEAHICSICNYTQLHRKNMVRHLRTQHAIYTISQNHIIKVVLLQISAPHRDQDSAVNDESQLSLLQPSDDEDNGIKDEPLDENSLMMQNHFTDNDDLSFMICGMLDVQTNLSQPGGEYSGHVDTTNSVDKK